MGASSGSAARATVVLVHGAWHGAWCWERVLGGLSTAGVDALAVDLPGHGADPGPLSDLHGDAARVRSTLDRVEGPVVLLGHSYGGAVVTEAGTHPNVAHVVYLAAFALDEGESCAGAATEAALSISHDGRPDLVAGFEYGPEGSVTLEASVAAACLYNDCDRATTEWAVGRLGPQPLVTLQQAPSGIAWKKVPSTYVVCLHDQAIHPDFQRTLARRCTTTLEWPTDHSPFLSRPELLVDLLSELAAATR